MPNIYFSFNFLTKNTYSGKTVTYMCINTIVLRQIYKGLRVKYNYMYVYFEQNSSQVKFTKIGCCLPGKLYFSMPGQASLQLIHCKLLWQIGLGIDVVSAFEIKVETGFRLISVVHHHCRDGHMMWTSIVVVVVSALCLGLAQPRLLEGKSYAIQV